MPTALVLGANGRFGAAATQAFAAAGWRVLAQVRRAPTGPLPAGARALAIPLHDTAALAAAATGAQVVVHAVNPVYTRWAAEALPALQQGLAVALALGARFMLPGNVYNHGSRLSPMLREDTPAAPDHAKARIRCEMEALMQQRADVGLRSVVIRAGDFFGSGSGSWFDQAIVKGIARGRLVYPGPLDRVHAWAYLPDLAQAFVAVAAREQQAAFETLHFAGHAVTGQQFIDATIAAAHEIGLRPAGGWHTGGMPWALIRAGGLVVPMWRELAAMRYLWEMPHALDGSRLQARVGTLQHTPLQAALRQSLIDLGLAPAVQPTPHAHA